MNGAQMKKGVLWFLLACNLVLLALIAVFGVRSALRVSADSRRTVALLESRGVTVSGDVYKALLEEKTAYTIHTDADARDTFSNAFLNGSAEASAQSGGSIQWTGDTGSITWAADSTVTGSFDLTVFGTVVEGNAEQRITGLLKKAGVDLDRASVESTESDTGTVVCVQESVNGKKLTGCELTFTVDSEGQVQLDGKWCLAEPEQVVLEGLADSTPADILLALATRHSDVTQVTAVSQVYVLSNKSGGRFTALPCWKLTTDQGEFILNPLTGEEVDSTGQTGTTDTAADSVTDWTDSTDAEATDSDTTTGIDSSVSTDTTTETPDTDTTDDTDTDSTEWDSSQGTDKTDPELPDENGVYG